MTSLRLALSAAAAMAGLSVPRLVSAAPLQSSPIAVTADGTRLVNVNQDTHSLSIFDVTTSPPRKLGETRVGSEPVSVAIDPVKNIAYVACAFSGTVVPVDVLTRRAGKPLTVGAEPMGVCVSPNGTRLYVACASPGEVHVFDLSTPKPTLVRKVNTNAFGTSPRALAVTNDGDANDNDETVFVTLFFSQLRPGKTPLDEGQDDQREGRVVAFDSSGNLLSNNPITLGPLSNTGFNSNGRLAPANGLTPAVPSTNPNTFTTPTGAFPNQLAALAIHPTFGLVYVPGTGASPNGPLRFNTNVQGLVSVFNGATRMEVVSSQTGAGVRQTAPLNLNQGVNLATTPAPRLFNSNPVVMAWRPNGADAWLAIQNTDVIVRLTVDGGGIPTIGAPLVAGPSQIVRVDLQDVATDDIPGKAPRGIAITPDGTRAFVSNYVSRSITEINISSPTSPVIASTVLSTRLPRPNSRDATLLLGAELFHTGRGPQERMSSEGWGACVVCHPNGRSDNITWMFDTGPRQTIPLDSTFDPRRPTGPHRILNWSAVRDENQDFELNTRGVFGGRGLIQDDRLFLVIGGQAGSVGNPFIEQFNQFTGFLGLGNDLKAGDTLPELPEPRRDFGLATLGDDRVFIIGGRSDSGQGTLVTGPDTVLEFNPRTNVLRRRGSAGFTPRHSLGAVAVNTNKGPRIYAIGGYDSTDAAANPVPTVQEFNPATNRWRTVAPLPTGVAQTGVTAAGGHNSAEPLPLIHVVSGNQGSESAPVLLDATTFTVQRFQPDGAGPGTWTTFNPGGLTPRRNHGIATALRGVNSRIFVIGGQDVAGTGLDMVEEYQAQSGSTVATPHTALPAPRARFGIGSTLTTNQIYVIGGVNGSGTDQSSVFEYTIANNGPVAGPPGTPSGNWVTRANMPQGRSGLSLSSPPGVTNFLPFDNKGRSFEQDALTEFIRRKVRAPRAPTSTATNPAAKEGRILFGKKGLVFPNVSCATCHGGAKWTRSAVDYVAPPTPDTLGKQQIIGAELRGTRSQPLDFLQNKLGVLLNVGTFAPNSPGGRVNEIRANSADTSQAIAPLGANGFNIPSLLGVHETAPYFYSGLAPTLADVLNGAADGNGGTRHHFVIFPDDRTKLVEFLRSIDEKTPIFP